MSGKDQYYSGTTNFERPKKQKCQKTRGTGVPFTAQELKSMYGLTVEEALAKGFNVDWYNRKKPLWKVALPRRHMIKNHGIMITQIRR